MELLQGSAWYVDWQHDRHAGFSDFRRTLDAKNLVRNDEAFNDVRLLNERMHPSRAFTLVEVGCASGEFCRYLGIRYPNATYHGLDISEPAIARARSKYPQGSFHVSRPDAPLEVTLSELGLPAHPEVVYAKDVVHHQTRPLTFISQLLRVPSEMLIMRCRTRDVGATEEDPERSCQYHYSGWMPYIVSNLQELMEHIAREAPGSEVLVYRSHVILGGRYNRFLPKALYLEETGTAETAVGVLLRTDAPGRVQVKDRMDQNPAYTLAHRLRQYARRAVDLLRGSPPA